MQDSLLDFVASLTHGFYSLSFGIGKRPVVAPETENVRTFISAAHRDEQFGILRQLCREI